MAESEMENGLCARCALPIQPEELKRGTAYLDWGSYCHTLERCVERLALELADLRATLSHKD